jgi:hypothetical protein
VLDYAPASARLVFSCGWHITSDGQDVYSRKLKAIVKIGDPLARWLAPPTSTTKWRHAGVGAIFAVVVTAALLVYYYG